MTLIIIMLVLYIHAGLFRTSQKANAPLQLQCPAKTNGNLSKLIEFKGLSLCLLVIPGMIMVQLCSCLTHKLLVIF